MTFGEKLKAARKRSGLSQEQFAETLHVSRSAVAKWESDTGIPDVGNLKAISRVLHVSIDALLDENAECDAEKMEMHPLADAVEPEICDTVKACPKYAGYYCTIELTGWHDGVSEARIIGEDRHFVYYRRATRKASLFGMIGKQYITAISKEEPIADAPEIELIDSSYFVNKHVTLEIKHREGIIEGFLDFSNDDYQDVVIQEFHKEDIQLLSGQSIRMDQITKIEELPIA